jgi:Peptidase M61 N-terminal domain
MRRAIPLLAALVFAGPPSLAGERAPAAPGLVDLTVRLPHPTQRIFEVDEEMPVQPGSLTLYYPKWIPGDHAPDGPIGDLMGLEITADGKRIAWRRDGVDMFAFHLTVHAGVNRIDVRFSFPRRIGSPQSSWASNGTRSPCTTPVFQPGWRFIGRRW